jgi:hypothetical protein
MDDISIPIILDIEASGFGRGSYPIEIGLAMPDTNAHCYLIKPQPDWQHWEDEAEALHHLSRDTLRRFGHEVDIVANKLNHFLQGQTVYSDAWSNDSTWLAQLFECSNTLQDFRIEHLLTVTSEAQLAIWDKTRQRVIEECGYQRHRASGDAKIIQTTWLRTLALSQVVGL